VTVPLARTSEEAHLFMDLNRCACGQAAFGRDSVLLSDGSQLLRRYAGACPGCGAKREFVFRVPDRPVPPAPRREVRFGSDEPSELVDAGQWMWIADSYAGLHSADPGQIPPAELPRARADLAYAAAAMDEVAKFVPAGADAVPESALWTERGRELYRREPYRFRLSTIDAVRDTYRRLLARLS
jgi:hypothetical protein